MTPPLLPATSARLVASPEAGALPSLIADAGDAAGWRFIDFFTANIRNPNTRRAYLPACRHFFGWCGERGRALETIQPYNLVSYIGARQQAHSAPNVKQQLAAIRRLFDLLVIDQVVPTNPAAAVRGPNTSSKPG